MKYKLILADDHQILIQGMKSVLHEMEHVEVVATVADGKELQGQVTLLQPHLVVLDLNMPGIDGFESLKAIKKVQPGVKVLILTNYNQPEIIEHVKKLGAQGFMTKNTTAIQMKEVISKILQGEEHFPVQQSQAPGNDHSFFVDGFLKRYQLTRREVTIIQLVCRGLSSKDIANQLFLSELTVKTHRRNIMRKLDVKSVAGLMNFAKENNIT